MRLVPLIKTNKRSFYEKVVADGNEGVMLKDLNAPYVHEGRPKSMYKAKRFEEVDAYVTGGNPGDDEAGWRLLIGDIEFSCVTEAGKIHMVADCSNLKLEDRIAATVCGFCGSGLDVNHMNQDGKRVIVDTTCKGCAKKNVPPILNPTWKGRVAEIRGQEFTARVYRLKHAVIERWRLEGVDAKTPAECTINLADVQKRFEISQIDL